ncbi:hypothetical protein [Gemmatimonas sp.]|jgi:hypothetical protein|uniref:hypothetical protein n=1 Tax=Gemmatimonas sp. TaxID=1962908 RepID=UPI00391A9D72
MTSFRPVLSRWLVQSPPVAALLLGACGDGGANARDTGRQRTATAATAQSPCAGRDTTALRVAVLHYITTADPRPQRFLSAFGTDSALPEDGFRSLQDTGPTYYYNDNPKNQAQVRARLEVAGPYTTMLVVYKGRAETDNGQTVTVTLGGHYVGGAFEGRVAPVRAIAVRCDSTGWRLPASIPKAAVPPTAAPTAAAPRT